MEKEWGKALEKAQRFTSLAFFFAMMTGSAFYDSSFVNSCLGFLGFDFSVSDETTIKIPIFLTFISSLIVLGAALGQRETIQASNQGAVEAIRLSLRKTKVAGVWVLTTAFPFGILLAAMILDSVIRQFLTIASAYWSVIEIPLWTFGLVASGMSLMGIFVPRGARWLADRKSPSFNFFLICIVLTIGLFGLGYAIPIWGILPAALLYASMQSMHYLISRYLNEEASSERRATVLSFRGLATNLSYGTVSLLYSGLIAWIKTGQPKPPVERRNLSEQEAVFVESLGWFPWYFLCSLVLVLIVYRFRFGKKSP